jgi:hypothetical protein
VGNNSLTLPGIHPKTVRRETPKTGRGEAGWTSKPAQAIRTGIQSFTSCLSLLSGARFFFGTTSVLVPGVLGRATTMAALVAAWRSARMQPMSALRSFLPERRSKRDA